MFRGALILFIVLSTMIFANIEVKKDDPLAIIENQIEVMEMFVQVTNFDNNVKYFATLIPKIKNVYEDFKREIENNRGDAIYLKEVRKELEILIEANNQIIKTYILLKNPELNKMYKYKGGK